MAGTGTYIIASIMFVIGLVLTIIGLGTIGVPMMASAVAMVASAMLAPKPEEPKDFDQKKKYGIDARVNSPNRPIPLCYGRTMVKSPPMIWGPKVEDQFVRDGKLESVGRLTFEAAYGICLGEILQFEKIATETGLDLDNISRGKKKSIIYKYGTKDQRGISAMNAQVSYVPIGVVIDKYDNDANNVITLTTTKKIEGFGLVFANPSGLYFKEKAEERAGAPGPKACKFKIEIKRIGDPETSYRQVNHNESDNAQYEVVRTTVNPEDSNSSGSITTIGNATSVTNYKPKLWTWGGILLSTVRREFRYATVYKIIDEIYKWQTVKDPKTKKNVQQKKLVKKEVSYEPHYDPLPLDFYNIRITNLTETVYTDDVDDVQLIGIEEIVYTEEEALAYPHLAYIYLFSASTKNLENSMLSLEFTVKGRKVVDLYNYWTNGNSNKAYSTNAANIVADILTDKLVGIYKLSDLDRDSFLEFYDWCDETLKTSEIVQASFTLAGDKDNINTKSVYSVVGTDKNNNQVPLDADAQIYWVRRAKEGQVFLETSDYEIVSGGIKIINTDVGPGGATKLYTGQNLDIKWRNVIKRGQISATFDDKTSYSNAITDILEPLQAYIYQKDGKWAIAIDRNTSGTNDEDPTPVLEIDVQNSSYALLSQDGKPKDVNTSNIAITSNSVIGRANQIRLRYPNAANRWKDELVILEDPDEIERNGIQVLEKTCNTIATREQAENYAAYLLKVLNRKDITVSIGTMPIGQVLCPGDVIKIIDSTKGWNTLFKITNVANKGIAGALGVELIAVPFDRTKYANDNPTTQYKIATQAKTEDSAYKKDATTSIQGVAFKVVK